MKFIILVSNLKRDIITQRFLLKKKNIHTQTFESSPVFGRRYKKNYDAILVKIRFGRKKRLNYAYRICVEKWSRSVQHLFFIFTQSLLNPPFCVVFVQNPSMFLFLFEHVFFINKQFRTCANVFPNEFTVRSYEYCVGQH